MIEQLIIPEQIKTYSKDSRMRIQDLFRYYSRLAQAPGWVTDKQPIFVQEVMLPKTEETVRLPIISIRTEKTGAAFWALFGIHGEEPAGPNALAISIDEIVELGKIVPVVVFPILNPAGYFRDWRFYNEHRNIHRGQSVGSSEHLLLNPHGKPRKTEGESPAAIAVTNHVMELTNNYPPVVVIDHHEDEDHTRLRKRRNSYIYSQGKWKTDDRTGREINNLLVQAGMPMTVNSETRFDEVIVNGMLESSDGSIDELLAAEKVYYKNQVVPGPNARTVITVETPTLADPRERISLVCRIAAHREIIKAYPRLLEISNRQEREERVFFSCAVI